MDESTKAEIASLRLELQQKREEIKAIQQKLAALLPPRVKAPQP
jgi:hypothetical protein